MTPGDLLALSLVISGIFMAILGLFGWRHAKRIPLALPYSLLMWAAAGWALLYALGLFSGSLPERVLYHNLQFLFLAFIPVIELWLVLAFIGRVSWLTGDRVVALLVIPVATIILALTSPSHSLFRYAFSIDTSGPLPVLTYAEGPLYQIGFIYSLALLITTYIILVYETRKQGTLSDTRTVLLLIALVLPSVINYLFSFGISPVPGVNMTAPLLWVPAVLYTLAIFRYRFLDLVPLARNQVIETMNTPMLVLDTEGRIIDHNQAAGSLFPIAGDRLLDRQISDVAVDWPEFQVMCRSVESGSFHLDRPGEAGNRTWLGSVDLLTTPGGGAAGSIIILRDTTDLEKTRDALIESERKYRNLYRFAEVGLFETSLPDAKIISCNQKYADLFGFDSPEEAAGQDVLGLYVNPDERIEVGRHLRETGKLDNHIVQFRNRRTGTVFTGQFSARWNRQRDVAEGTIIDITKQREDEEKIRHLASFPQLTPFLIVEVDLSGTVLFANPAMETLVSSLGLPDPLAFVPPGCLGRLHHTRYDERTQWKTEITIAGHTFEETIYFTPEFDSLRIYAADITDRKLAEEAMRAANTYLNNLLDYANAPIIVWDPAFRITRFNHAFEKLTGRADKEVLGQHLKILFPEESRQASLEQIYKTLAGERWETVEIPILTIEGDTRTVLWNSATLYEADGTTVMAAIAQGQDITDRKLAEEAMRAANTYLNNLIDNANAPIIVWDPTFRITRFNHAFEKLTGWSEHEILGQNLEILFPEENKTASLALIQKTLAGERWETVEIPILTNDGDIRAVLWNSANIAGSGGGIVSTIAQGTDITDRSRAEEALRETNAYLSSLITFANAPIIVWDPQFRITRFNHAFERLTGLLSGQVIGREVDLLFPEKTREQSMTYLRHAMAGERWETVEIPILRADGGIRTVLWNSATLFEADGTTVIAAIAQGQDITERNLALDALRTSEERFRLSFEQASVGMSLTSPDGRLQKVNKAFCDMIGYTVEELQEKGVNDITHPDDRAATHLLIRSLLAGEADTSRLVKRFMHHDGSTVWADVSTILLHDAQGIPMYFVTHIMNITERIEAEHQREAMIRELEQKNAELERFAYTVSHDLKSPLITIKGFLGLLREDALTGNITRLDHDIGRIIAATNTMQALLSDLLSLSRIGRVVNPPELVNFGQIAEEAREILVGTISENGIRVVIAPDLPDVIVDRPRIREVLVNLIENAIKFRGDADEPRVEIGALDRDGELVFFVTDYGIGIDSRYWDRVFRLFEKLDPRSDGTGVGLAIVRRIVEVHGGRIWVESAGPGKGTTFFFTLPLADSQGP